MRMTYFRQIGDLHFNQQRSNREIADLLCIGAATVSRALTDIRKSGRPWSELETMSESELQALLRPNTAAVFLEPDFALYDKTRSCAASLSSPCSTFTMSCICRLTIPARFRCTPTRASALFLTPGQQITTVMLRSMCPHSAPLRLLRLIFQAILCRTAIISAKSGRRRFLFSACAAAKCFTLKLCLIRQHHRGSRALAAPLEH